MRSKRPVLGIFLLFVLTLVVSFDPAAFAAAVPRFAFVTNTGDNTVSIYTVNGTSGLLRDDGYVSVMSI